MCGWKKVINQDRGEIYTFLFSLLFFFKKNERGEFRKIFGEFGRGRVRERPEGEGMMIHLTFRNTRGGRCEFYRKRKKKGNEEISERISSLFF